MLTNRDITALPTPVCLLGESPFWHPQEQALYWCDIPGRTLHHWKPDTAEHASWQFYTELGSCAPLASGGLLLALRGGLLRFNPATGRRVWLAAAPYDVAVERFNDGKTDPQGRFWVGTIWEPRDGPRAALYRFDQAGLALAADGVTVSNGLAWSPDGATMYWADTPAHVVYALDFDRARGAASNRRTFAAFAKPAGADLNGYAGRPDGAAVDAEGCYWVAMFEGGRVLRISPAGEILQEVRLPVRCPTMPCFGGDDLKTLYITTAREKRPPEELASQPLAGHVLQLRVEVPGLPVSLARLDSHGGTL